jgi:hypothetical protein
MLALADGPDGTGGIQPIAKFMTNPAGAAIVNASGPLRQIVRNDESSKRRYLVIVEGTAERLGPVAQVQVPQP